MNKKLDILDAWIAIEQLSEGSIKIKEKQYKKFGEETLLNEPMDEKLLDVLNNPKNLKNISTKNLNKRGIVIYFDIFNFQEITDILREKYGIYATHEEISSSTKFTFALYFDYQLKFLPDKLFFTISGYIRYKREFPEEFFKAEISLKEDLYKKFEENSFNNFLNLLLKQYQVELANCRYVFVEDLENCDVNMHSFFIDDLKKAKKIDTPNLKRYFNGYSGNRINLDSQKKSVNFNTSVIQKILQPKYYPLGRYVSSSDYPLSLMQEVAIHLTLNEKNDIQSINGPPGTGKTTLLKEIFADLVVQQAVEICNLSKKPVTGDLFYQSNRRFGVLPRQIADKNMVLASSNNGALQNIVNELPQIKEVAKEFEDEILAADYFETIANIQFSIDQKNQIKKNLIGRKNWGMFSVEGGKSVNIQSLLAIIDEIVTYLKTDYQSKPAVYEEFSELYYQLVNERQKVQKYAEKIQELPKLKCTCDKKEDYYNQNKQEKMLIFAKMNDEMNQKLESLQRQITEFKNVQNLYQEKFLNFDSLLADAKREFEVVHSQKPNLFWLKKIIQKEKIQRYHEKLNTANEVLKQLREGKRKISNEHSMVKKRLEQAQITFESIKKEKEKNKLELKNWQEFHEKEINNLKDKIANLTIKLSESQIEALDFSKSYEELQLFNPWFTKEFRIKQSELFIKSLEVRKQYLYENHEHLSIAKMIWDKQNEYISKENGQQLILTAWKWINFAIPVISTTFASFGRMFRHLPENTISNLFIDEAGQATPQASVGAIFRSKKILVVGDPAQIKPILSLDSNILNLLAQRYKVDEKFISASASTQTIVDDASQFGFNKNEDEWIGIPLWVHRRSNFPMFTISNELSYNGLMVQGIDKQKAKGKAIWFDISGVATNKFVKEQAIFLKNELNKLSKEETSNVYVITPFRNIAMRLAKELDAIGFTKYINKKPINVGTVHTFQGKEADIVYLVLGADSHSKGSANWSISEPNIINVAATRAKKEFYIIGDKKLYSSLKSKVVDRTITIIDTYNLKGKNSN
ncbi:DEAD/DEAH box helicase [Enterococcus faecalis]|uniref:DEAD/DEAH box helicase n=1 Tax=Enterococcus faecalis TaxID=1351 RepID=UPI002890DE21|nr:AAA domain-containing protein [Enterococcus faecalis]MDT2164536.1 AAA domain-containing protein [Enterococcus faecalis]